MWDNIDSIWGRDGRSIIGKTIAAAMALVNCIDLKEGYNKE